MQKDTGSIFKGKENKNVQLFNKNIKIYNSKVCIYIL